MPISLDFTPVNLQIFFTNLGIIALCAVCGYWLLRRGEKGRSFIGLALLIAVAFLVMNWVARYPDADETEHLHAAWLMSQGELPYRDFWQHHSPLLWITLAPLLAVLPHDGTVCDVARLLSLALSAASWGLALLLARRVHRPSRGLTAIMLLFMAGALAPGEFYNLRPDLVANLCTMGALLLLFVPTSTWRILVSGVLLGLAVAFTPKVLPFVLLLPALLATERGAIWRKMRSLPAHYAGVIIGIAPLVLWLLDHQLLGDFRHWVMGFNRNFPAFMGGNFSLFFVLPFLFWAVRKIRVDRDIMRYPHRLLLIATLLSASTLFCYPPSGKFAYHLQLFMLLAAAAGAGEVRGWFASLAARNRGWVVGGVIALFLLSFPMLKLWLDAQNYAAGRAEIGLLAKVAANDTVVCIPPRHPIFARDATDLNQPWQWYDFLRFPEVRQRLQNVDTLVEDKKPAIIFCSEDKAFDGEPQPLGEEDSLRFVKHLLLYRVITPEHGVQLQTYLQDNYTLMRFVRHYYWVRNDLVEQAK